MLCSPHSVNQSQMTGKGKSFYEREFDFFSAITGVSGKIRDKPLGPERKVRQMHACMRACVQAS